MFRSSKKLLITFGVSKFLLFVELLSGYVDGDGQREDCSFQLLDGGDKLGKRRRQRDRYENGWAGEEPGPHDGCKMNGGERQADGRTVQIGCKSLWFVGVEMSYEADEEDILLFG